MVQSPEFPELKFVVPRSWRSGRPSGQPTLVVIHDTEGSEGKTSAEAGAAYDAVRTDGTSTHFFVDADTCVQCVLTKDTAHHAMPTGNARGIGFELCGKASQSYAQWKDGGLDLRLAAKYVAKCCKKWNIPAKRLTVAEVQAGKRGICGHVDISLAFHESTHTDPGPNFPWTEFLSMVNVELHPEVFMALSDAEQRELLNRLRFVDGRVEALASGRDDMATGFPAPGEDQWVVRKLKALEAKIDAIAAKLG